MIKTGQIWETIKGPSKGRKFKIFLSTFKHVTTICMETGRRSTIERASFELKRPRYKKLKTYE